MIIGVMSDTHGNLRLMHEAADAMENRFQAAAVFHLGDDYSDSEHLSVYRFDLYRVPGLWCPEYQDSRISKHLTVSFDGISVACAHADKDLRYSERAAAIVLTGHTHTANIAMLGRSLYVNPGHLKSPSGRGQNASYAIIEITSEHVRAAIHEIASHDLRSETIVSRKELG